MKDINFDDTNLFNLTPSEKLVAILDGELEKSEVGNFFQELYQNTDLQDEFFDMINLKNNFKQTLYTPPSNLKSNILKGAGLIAASTLTYQTVATNNASWFVNLWTAVGSKLSIAIFSALTSALITFGVSDYLNTNNSNSILTNNSSNKQSNSIVIANEKIENANSNLNSHSQLASNENNNKENNQKFTRKNIALTSAFDGNSNLSSGNSNNNSNLNSNKTEEKSQRLYKNDNLDKTIISDEHIYSNNSLISGAVPESRYKVEYISKSDNDNDKTILEENIDSQIQENISSQNTNNKLNTKSILDPNEFEIINEGSDRSKYIEEQNKLSLHFRNFSAKGINNFTAPQMENPIINNIAAGLLYEINNNWLVGVELGQENFEQEFVAQNGNYKINVQQNYLAFWGGGAIRYRFVNPDAKLTNIQPYVNLFLGSTDRGPLVKPSLGTIYQISNDFSIFGALEYTVLYSKYTAVWYNSQKYGMTYGFIIKL